MVFLILHQPIIKSLQVNVIQTRFCLSCNKPLKGRTDKKFCDDQCRNHYNNQLKANSNNLVRNINHSLGKNRRILEGLLMKTEDMRRVSKEDLLAEGFQFKYITHIYRNSKGACYLFCYDYGYLALENDWYLLVKRKEEE